MTTDEERAAEEARRERLRISEEAVRQIDKDFDKNYRQKER